MRIIVDWTEHDRKYTIGIRQFLLTAGIDLSDEEIKNVIRKLLSNDGLSPTE